MSSEVEYTDQFEEWWDALTTDEQRRTEAAVEVLEERGPGLGRPWVDTPEGSRHPEHEGAASPRRAHADSVRSTLAELRSCFSEETRAASGRAGTSRRFSRPTSCMTNICANCVTKEPSREPEDQEVP